MISIITFGLSYSFNVLKCSIYISFCFNELRHLDVTKMATM